MQAETLNRPERSRTLVLFGTGGVSFNYEVLEDSDDFTYLTFFWDYGAGTTITHTPSNPQLGSSHEYQTTDTFTVMLTVNSPEDERRPAHDGDRLVGDWHVADQHLHVWCGHG